MTAPSHIDLTTLTFKGPDFEDHGLEIDALPDLVAYKALVSALAEAVWRSNNPDRVRLPKRFHEDIRLKFFGLQQGSVSLAIKRVVPRTSNGQQDFAAGAEVDTAAVMLEEAIEEAGRGGVLPDSFPKQTIALFDGFGKSLRAGHHIELASREREAPVRYTPALRDRLIGWASTHYEDSVDLVGEVRQADLDGAAFTLRLDDGRKVSGRFEPEHEDIVTNALRDHASRRVRVSGTARFTERDGNLDRLVEVAFLAFVPAGAAEYDDTVEPMWVRLAQSGNAIEPSVWDAVPTDLAERLDHYLQGGE